jgi:hypothetical protein
VVCVLKVPKLEQSSLQFTMPYHRQIYAHHSELWSVLRTLICGVPISDRCGVGSRNLNLSQLYVNSSLLDCINIL